jgi:cbb3-type cytochrome oxidase subunit 3
MQPYPAIPRSTPVYERPTGVTTLAILAIVGGILALIVASLGLIVGGWAAILGFIRGAEGGLAVVELLTMFFLAIVSIVLGVGAWQLKAWAWPVGIITRGLAIILSLIFVLTDLSTWPEQTLDILFSIAVLYYLFTPRVKAAFDRP